MGLERLLEKSTQRLPPQKASIYSSVTVLHGSQVAQLSSDQNGTTARASGARHRGKGETLRIVVEIMLFDSVQPVGSPGE